MTKTSKVLIALFILGLIYILAPGPSSIDDFPPIPNSLKSDEPGDTYQVPNVVAYFSDYDRVGITNFYKDDFRNKFFFGKLIPLLVLNHPPLYAKTVVRDQINVTFIEEYTYPLKGSIFVAGYEPFIENEMFGREHFFIRDHIQVIKQSDRYFKSKTTIRYYPAAWHVSLVTYVGIWVVSFALLKIFRKALSK